MDEMDRQHVPKPQGRLVIAPGASPSSSERRAAKLVADLGFDVTLRPPVGARSSAGGTADALINGLPYDIYSPRTASSDRIISAVASKGDQAYGVVLDLTDTLVTRSQLSDVLIRVQRTGSRIQSILVVSARRDDA